LRQAVSTPITTIKTPTVRSSIAIGFNSRISTIAEIRVMIAIARKPWVSGSHTGRVGWSMFAISG
jgi:hypothetical protein